MADLDRRGHVAQSHARRPRHADGRPELLLQRRQQVLAAKHGAGQAVADAHGQFRDVGLAILHHVEVGVEGCGLEHLGEGQSHLVGQGGQVIGRDLAEGVLDQMQVLDQQVALARALAQQGLDRHLGAGVDLPPLRRGASPLPAPARMLELADLGDVFVGVMIAHVLFPSETALRLHAGRSENAPGKSDRKPARLPSVIAPRWTIDVLFPTS